jgi:serine protease Do
VQTLTPDLANQFGVSENKGVLIAAIEEGSIASMSDLQRGDLIVEANHKQVSSVAELESILGKDKERILLLIKRKNGSRFLVFRLN